jgi:hypothetical protein
MRPFAFALLLALPLLAQETKDPPRHIDFTQEIKGLDGKPVMNGDVKPAVAMTLGDVAVVALETSLDEDKGITGAVKFERDELARKVYKKSSVVLTAEQLASIKERIGKVYSAMIVGAAWRLLDPAVVSK